MRQVHRVMSTLQHFRQKALEPYCTDVTIDHMGNVIGFMGDKNAERQVMLDAHIDQIGNDCNTD